MRAMCGRLALLELFHAHNNSFGGGHPVFIGHGWIRHSGFIRIDHLGHHQSVLATVATSIFVRSAREFA